MWQWFLSILIFSNLTWAGDSSYIDAKAMKEKGIDVSTPYKAMIMVQQKAKSGGFDQCTGFFVSPSGYMVTALHCLNGCLEKDFKKVKTTSNEGMGLKLYSLGDKLKGKKCDDLKIFTPDGTYPDVTIVATGRSVEAGGEKQYWEVPPYDEYKRASLANDKMEDFVVLKVNTGTQPVTCVPINDSSVPVGETLWSERFESPDTFYFPAKHFVIGKRVSGAKMMDGGALPLMFGNYIYSDMGAISGNSGGPVMDENNKVRGIVNRKFNYTGIYTIKDIRNVLEAQLSKKEIDQIFDCPQKSLKSGDNKAAK